MVLIAFQLSCMTIKMILTKVIFLKLMKSILPFSEAERVKTKKLQSCIQTLESLHANSKRDLYFLKKELNSQVCKV